jgi:hypothetical protein
MMAPTKAKATYAVTTLSVPTKGLMKGIVAFPGFTRARPERLTQQSVPGEKSQRCCPSRHLHSSARVPTWLKIRENNALKSP